MFMESLVRPEVRFPSVENTPEPRLDPPTTGSGVKPPRFGGVAVIMPAYPSPRRFTIVEIEEWQALYEGENLVSEGREITIPELIRVADGGAFTLARILASGSPVEDLMLGTGTLENHKLSEIKEILAAWRNRFRL